MLFVAQESSPLLILQEAHGTETPPVKNGVPFLSQAGTRHLLMGYNGSPGVHTVLTLLPSLSYCLELPSRYNWIHMPVRVGWLSLAEVTLWWWFDNVLGILVIVPWHCHCLTYRNVSQFQKLHELCIAPEGPEQRGVVSVPNIKIGKSFYLGLEITKLLGVFVFLLDPVKAPRFLWHWVEDPLPSRKTLMSSTLFRVRKRHSLCVALGLYNKFYSKHTTNISIIYTKVSQQPPSCGEEHSSEVA